MLNISSIKDEIRNYITSSFAQPVVEQAIPDTNTVLRENGAIVNYIAFQFGDVQRLYGSGLSLAGMRNADHELPIRFQVVSGSPIIASAIADRVVDVMLGASFTATGEVRKRPGGGMFSIVESNAATEAYMFPSSFAVTLNLLEESTP